MVKTINEWNDSGNDLHSLTMAVFPSSVINYIVVSSHKTWIRYCNDLNPAGNLAPRSCSLTLPFPSLLWADGEESQKNVKPTG